MAFQTRDRGIAFVSLVLGHFKLIYAHAKVSWSYALARDRGITFGH